MGASPSTPPRMALKLSTGSIVTPCCAPLPTCNTVLRTVAGCSRARAQRMLIWAVAAVLATLAAVRLFGGEGGRRTAHQRRRRRGRRCRRAGWSPRCREPPRRPDRVRARGRRVRRPGLCRVPAGSRVAEAVARAGGLARRADPAAVNLAARLEDGQQVVVPGGGPGAAGPARGGAGRGGGRAERRGGGAKPTSRAPPSSSSTGSTASAPRSPSGSSSTVTRRAVSLGGRLARGRGHRREALRLVAGGARPLDDR